MKCDRCGQLINGGDEMDYYDQTLCEDCTMHAMSPNRACDPWAVQSAQTLSGIDAGYADLSAIQASILQVLGETGGLEAEDLAQELQQKPFELERVRHAAPHGKDTCQDASRKKEHLPMGKVNFSNNHHHYFG